MLCALLMDHVESNTAVQRSAALQFRTASRQLSAGVTLSSIRYIIVISAKISISAMCVEFNVHMHAVYREGIEHHALHFEFQHLTGHATASIRWHRPQSASDSRPSVVGSCWFCFPMKNCDDVDIC